MFELHKPLRGTALWAGRARAALLLVLLVALLPFTFAQAFDSGRLLEQCLRLEAGGDFESARQSCLNALELEPGNNTTVLALARLELQLGLTGSAENRLLQLRGRGAGAEPQILLAGIAIDRNDLARASGYLDDAERELAAAPNAALAARLSEQRGRLSERRGELQDALGHYRRAAASEPLEAGYYLAGARLLLQLGLPEAAAEELQQYRTVSGQRGDAALHALRGQALWAAGELRAAAAEYEAAYVLRAGRDAEAQAQDLRNLAAIYYGLGEIRDGNAVLSDSLGRGNLVQLFAGNALLWLLLLVALAAVHLVNESRIPQHRSAQPVDGPLQWSIGKVYSVLFTALLVAVLAVALWSALAAGNYLAFLTPLQADATKAVFLISFSIVAAAGSIISVRRHGWNAAERLLGEGGQIVPGVLWGLLLLVIAVVWQRFVPAGLLNPAWHLELSRLSGLTVAALVVLPFSELYFRAFALPAFEKRYSGNMAVFLAAALYALVLGTPVLLSLVIGVLLGLGFLRSSSGLYVISAQLVLQLGMVLLQIVSPGLVPPAG